MLTVSDECFCYQVSSNCSSTICCAGGPRFTTILLPSSDSAISAPLRHLFTSFLSVMLGSAKGLVNNVKLSGASIHQKMNCLPLSERDAVSIEEIDA